MKTNRILYSLMIIGFVGVAVFGATQAWFSDSVISEGNTITTGTIELNATTGSDNSFTAVTIDDMKPSYVRWTQHTVRNTGNNPMKLWKRIHNVVTEENEVNQPECLAYGGIWNGTSCDTPTDVQNDIDRYIVYDIYLGGTVEGNDVNEGNNWFGGVHVDGTAVITEEAGLTLHDVEGQYIYLGEVPVEGSVVVWQSYHMKAETGNWAQSDTATFTIEFYAEQTNGDGPTGEVVGGPSEDGPYALLLENKNHSTDWLPIFGDDRWGVLTWAGDGDTFDFSATLEAHGLLPSTSYDLVYAPDPWPQAVGTETTLLGTNSSNASGDLTISNNPDLGYDIPHPDEDNDLGGKIWLVLSSDHDDQKMTAWNPGEYLFEYWLIKYNDTNAP